MMAAGTSGRASRPRAAQRDRRTVVQTSFSYGAAAALVFDPVGANRFVTRSALFRLGFRQIGLAASLDELRQMLIKGTGDLVLCEVGAAAPGAEGLLQSIRFGDLGANPFLTMIATSWTTSRETVLCALNAGCDDLLCRPFSVTQLESRLRQIITRRKGFVVTADYVGPDRRRAERAEGSAPLFQVPNALRAKVDPLAPAEAAGEEGIAQMRTQILEERLKRIAFQLCVAVELITETGGGPLSPAQITEAQKAIRICEDLARRVADTGQPEVASFAKMLEETFRLIVGGQEVTANLARARQTAEAVLLRLDGTQSAETLGAVTARIRGRQAADDDLAKVVRVG